MQGEMIALFTTVFDSIKSLNISKTHKSGLFVLIFLFYTCTGKHVKDHHFDYFVFSQRWLPSACIEYMEKDIRPTNSHFCSLPKNFKSWRIHGLWPTQDNSLGPFFCNRSMAFDIDKIKPLESDLELCWPNIEGGKSIASLWQHEWDKHGTCSAQLESLNSEMKYFNTTLMLYKTYNMQVLFNRSNIIPSEKGISVPHLLYLIKDTFGKLPWIHCIHEVKTKQSYLSEIHLCYDKSLELIDCKTTHGSKLSLTHGLTNCPDNKNVIFPDKVSLNSLSKETVTENSESLVYFNKLYDILLIIRFLQWVSI